MSPHFPAPARRNCFLPSVLPVVLQLCQAYDTVCYCVLLRICGCFLSLLCTGKHCTFLFHGPPDCVLHRSGRDIFLLYFPRKTVSDKHLDQTHNYNHRRSRPSTLPGQVLSQMDRHCISLPVQESSHGQKLLLSSTVHRRHRLSCHNAPSHKDISAGHSPSHHRSTFFLLL